MFIIYIIKTKKTTTKVSVSCPSLIIDLRCQEGFSSIFLGIQIYNRKITIIPISLLKLSLSSNKLGTVIIVKFGRKVLNRTLNCVVVIEEHLREF